MGEAFLFTFVMGLLVGGLVGILGGVLITLWAVQSDTTD